MIIPENKKIIFPNISGSQQRKNHYVKESVVHPAKMRPDLCRWIIKKYSKPGDTILDPMSGIGTSLIEASLLNRNAIGIEYEQKFVNLIKKSIKKSMGKTKGMNLLTDSNRGWMRIIHGDSRYLPQFLSGKFKMIQTPVLKEGYTLISMEESLEYEKELREEVKKTGKWPKEEDFECSWETKWMLIDTITMSPPFFSTVQERGPQGEGKRNIAVDPAKHGHKGIAILYAETEDNIDNLQIYGTKYLDEIDHIFFSPTYGHGSYTSEKTQWRKDNEDWGKIGHEKHAEYYGDSKGNIGMIDHEPDEEYPFPEPSDWNTIPKGCNPDTIVTSPPFGHEGSVYNSIDPEIVKNNPNMKGRKAFSEEAAESYSTDPNNIGKQKGETYLAAMLKVYAGCYQVLKDDGYMVLVTKNFVRQGKVVRLDLDTIKIVEMCHKGLFCECDK